MMEKRPSAGQTRVCPSVWFGVVTARHCEQEHVHMNSSGQCAHDSRTGGHPEGSAGACAPSGCDMWVMCVRSQFPSSTGKRKQELVLTFPISMLLIPVREQWRLQLLMEIKADVGTKESQLNPLSSSSSQLFQR